MAEQPTAEEIAAYEAQFGAAVKPQINPLRDLSAEDIAALAVKDKEHFIIPDEFARAKDLHGDPAFVQKVADAFNIVNQRGFKLEDLPSVPQAAGAVGTAIKGLAGQAWNYANVAGNVLAGAGAELVGAEGLASGYAENISKRLAENVAGTEEAMTGLSQIAQKGARKAGQISGIAKDFSEYTPAEKVTELFNKSGESEVRNERLTGKGEFSKAVTSGQGGELNPEKVGELAAGDPFSFYLFGGAAGAAGKALKAVTPTVVSGAAGAIARGATGLVEAALPKVVGGSLTAAGVTAKGAAKAVETVAPAAGAIGGGIAGGASYGVPGAIAGVGAGFASGKAIARGAGFVGRQAEKLADVGRQVAGSVPIKSAYTQAGRDFLQAIPGAAGDVAKGAALDLGLAAATAEVPQDVQGAVGFGTALGALGGVARVGGRVVSGQLIAPRSYGVNTVVPSSGQFRGLDAMHADAMKAAQPGVKARLNALRDFAQGVAPGTDIFLGRDSVAVENALLDAGVAPATAKAWSQAEGFFTTDLPGKDGQPRRVVIARNVDSVPHEAQHIIQDVLGEEANQRIDALVKDTYADQWENEGQKYASRLTERGDPRNWREVILDETGTGLSEAKEKIYRDIYNRLETESGIAPSPKLVEEMAKAELGHAMDDAVVRHPDADPNAVSRHVWRDVFQDAPEEVIRLSDKYIARELAAENFDAIVKNQGPRLTEGTQLPQRLARVVGGVMSALGSEPLAGRVSELGGTPLSSAVIEAVRNAAKGLQGETPVVTPRAPVTPRVRVAPGSAEAVQGAADEARVHAAEAPAEIAVGGTRSPRELLGQIAESIATQEGIRINYLSAPGEPAAATTSNRTVRREIIEAFRTMPPEARALWEKTFFPDRVIRTKSGAYQVQGWAPEVFASNAHKLAKFFAETPGSEVLSPYAIDATAKTFTPEAWQELYRDTQDFVQNQMRGATGSGEPLVVPKSVTDAGGFAPPTRPGATPLAQGKADFINALFNFKLPETPRVQVGKRPLNVIGQEVSGATIPGRVEIPVRPRGEFTGEEAARQGIEGVSIAEVNPFRNQLEAAAQAAGKPPPSFIEAIQKLNLENIKEVEGTPESPQFRGNTLTLTAGLQPAIQQRATERSWRISGQVRGASKQITVNAPDIAAARKLAEAQNMRIARVESVDKMLTGQLAARTDTGRRVAEERGFEIRHTGTPENPGVAMFKEGVPVGEISAVRNSPIEADIDNIKINQGFRGQGLSEILYREMGKRLQDEGVETVTGMIIDKRALAGRSKIFPETKVENEIRVGESAPAFEVRSTIRPTSQFSPAEVSARVEKFTPDEFREWAKTIPDGLTAEAYRVGQAATDQAFVDSLKQSYEALGRKTKIALRAMDFDRMGGLAQQAQFFQEAYQAATGTGSAGESLLRADPNYKPPFPEAGSKTPTAQLAPKATPEVRQIADEYAKARGITLPKERKYAQAPEPLLKELADFYETAEHAPSEPAVQSSYDALTKETADQYQTMVDAGYTIEPWREEGQPYANSEAMVADVRDNKHLYYFPSERGFGESNAPANNPMLADSGIVVNGESIPYNDLFRAVHDFYGHAKEGYQFGPRGEFNAWGTHSEMYSPEAQGALAAETLAQNSFVNYGPHMRNESGTIRKPGEEGYLGVADRPFAEQKNVIVPEDLIEQARAQFAPKKKAEDKYALKPPSAGFSKAWILPSGEPVQLGGTWHHKYLADNPAIAAKYKLNVPEFTGTDTEGVRESALKAGFARVNHSQNSGTLTVEARARDWRKVKGAVERMVESNLDNIDNMAVHLMDESGTKTVDSMSAKLFNYDDAEKLQHLPFITEGEPRGQFSPSANRDSEYSSAIKSGDLGAARKLVEQAAFDAGYRIGPVSHGSPEPGFNEFRIPSKGNNSNTFGSWEVERNAAFFTPDDWASDSYAAQGRGEGEVRRFYLSVEPLDFRKGGLSDAVFNGLVERGVNERWLAKYADGYGDTWEMLDRENDPDSILVEAAKKMGYDGAVFTETDSVTGESFTTYAVFDPKQIKSADLFTQDGEDVIPLSARFNDAITDVRFQPKAQRAPKKDPAEVRRGLTREVQEAAIKYPEALPLEYRRGPNGAYRLDANNQPIPLSKEYRLTETPLAREATKGVESSEGQEAAIAAAYADKLKEAYAEAAKDPAVIAGKDWYSLTRSKLQSLFGEDTKFFAELLGATSAQTDVASNYRYALDAYNKFKAGDYDAIVQKYREGKQMWESGDISAARALDTENKLGENPTQAAFRKFWIEKNDLKPTRSNNKLFGANSDAVLRVLDGSWREEVQGPKTPNFADNLSGDSFEATIDIWAARLLRRLGHEGAEGSWRILPKNESSVSDKDFFLAQKAFRQAGDELGVSPDSLQAIVWFLEKGHWDKNGWTKTAGALKSDFNTFLDVTARTPEGRLAIAEVEPKPKRQKVDKRQLDFGAQFQPAQVEARPTPARPAAFVPLPPAAIEEVADAIYLAEGGAKAKKPYGILSVKVKDADEARRVAMNTVRNNWKRWHDAGKPDTYLEFLARRYAPVGAENDPKGLNKNWLKNVKSRVKTPLTLGSK